VRHTGDLDLLLVAIGSIVAAALASIGVPMWLQLPIGLVAALILPGYSLSMVLFPPGDLDWIERSALSFTLSLCIVIVLAPILDRSAAGLTEAGLVGAVTAVSLVATLLGWLRRRRGPAGDAHAGIEPGRESPVRSGARPWIVASLGVAGALFVALLATGAAAQSQNTTEFFLLGPPGISGGSPAQVIARTPTSVTVGIANADDSGEPYRVVVESRSGRLGDTGPIEIDAGQTWTGDVAFTVPEPGEVELQILLYQGASQEPYRSLRLNVDAVAPA
jgi:uncharacterized membrane protein